MNIAFVTMGAFVKVYHDVYIKLKKSINIEKVGFYTCDREYYARIEKDLSSEAVLLKEWEVVEFALKQKIDWDEVKRIEKEYYQEESIWEPLYNDRRVFLGKYCKVTQDYSPMLSYEQMIKIFLYGTLMAEKFLDKLKPDVLVGFAPASFGEYLIYQVAKGRNISFLTHRSAKIQNYNLFTTSLKEDFLHVRKTFELFNNKELTNDKAFQVAESYINVFKEKGEVPYEGNVKYNIDISNFFFHYPYKFVKLLILDLLELNKKRDHHNRTSHLLNFIYDKPLKDIRALKLRKRLGGRAKSLNEIKLKKYVFFPLHSEPEIAITLFAKHYQNQIEVIRQIALQLPAEYRLLVKEHPRNQGRRDFSYYKKILEIPNVDFAQYTIPTTQITKNVDLTIVLAGWVGFESILNQKPVIVLGNTSFNMLPKQMVNTVNNIKHLLKEIKWSLANFSYNEKQVKAFIAAMVHHSVAIDMYTVVLKKGGREGGTEYSDVEYQKNIEKLSDYLIDRIRFFDVIK